MSLVRLGPCVGVVAETDARGRWPTHVLLASVLVHPEMSTLLPRTAGKRTSLHYTRLYLLLVFLLNTFPSVGRRAACLDSDFVEKASYKQAILARSLP